MTSELPFDVINYIIRMAELDIDTRLGLRVKPRRLEKEVYNPVLEKLQNMHKRRCEAYKRNEECRKRMDGSGFALERFHSSPLDTGPRNSMAVYFTVWDRESDVQMEIEACETILDDPTDPYAHLLPPGSAEMFRRRGTYCIMHSGLPCERIFEGDDDFDF